MPFDLARWHMPDWTTKLGTGKNRPEAVQHAHQKGIIHRDLKPSNILVVMHDTTPVPKVIDFGVAKALGQELTDKTLFTGFAQMIGTPMDMSPEQAGQFAAWPRGSSRRTSLHLESPRDNLRHCQLLSQFRQSRGPSRDECRRTTVYAQHNSHFA
jgi:serine/threonine protein kinase